MATPILATKLYAPQLDLKVVLRPRLAEQLNETAEALRYLGTGHARGKVVITVE